jgi:CRISPR-associated protein Cst2
VSVAPVRLVSDFGTMSRHDGDPVPHEHQFYRTVLKGLFSLDLHMAGTFSYRNRTGYRNLDDYRREEAQQQGLEHLQDELCYRLPQADRVRRIAALLRGLAMLVGGAKQTIHYTDVTPAAIIAMVTRGGNNPLQYVVGADTTGSLQFRTEGLAEVVRVWGDQMLSPLYIGWVQGFQDDQRQRLLESLNTLSADGASPRLPQGFEIGHPREILEQLAQNLARNAASWMA